MPPRRPMPPAQNSAPGPTSYVPPRIYPQRSTGQPTVQLWLHRHLQHNTVIPQLTPPRRRGLARPSPPTCRPSPRPRPPVATASPPRRHRLACPCQTRFPAVAAASLPRRKTSRGGQGGRKRRGAARKEGAEGRGGGVGGGARKRRGATREEGTEGRGGGVGGRWRLARNSSKNSR